MKISKSAVKLKNMFNILCLASNEIKVINYEMVYK